MKNNGQSHNQENLLTKSIKRYKFQNYKIQPLIQNEGYNIFFFLSLDENLLNHYFFSVYEEFPGNYYLNYKPIFIKNVTSDKVKIIMVQIHSKDSIKNLIVTLKDIYDDNKSSIVVSGNILNFYNLDNLN